MYSGTLGTEEGFRTIISEISDSQQKCAEYEEAISGYCGWDIAPMYQTRDLHGSDNAQGHSNAISQSDRRWSWRQ